MAGLKNQEEVNAWIEDHGYEEVVVFSNPDYAGAFIGVTTDSRAIYDLNKMVEWLMEADQITAEEASEFIEYNTIRALDYQENGPIIMISIQELMLQPDPEDGDEEEED